nr:helix-turn-helix domain-containing protein [uncultured Acetatifactor sp.]
MDKETLKESLIDDICNYIEYLEQEPFGYHITLHQAERALGMYFHRFLKYNQHSCQICKEMKQSSRAQMHCVTRQAKVAEAAADHAILGTCFAGVTEYVFPLYMTSGNQCGFLCFSGYSVNPANSAERACAAAFRFNLSREKLVNAVSSLNRDIPAFETLSVQAAPLQSMFMLLFHLLNPKQIDTNAVNSQEALYLNMLSNINYAFRDPDFSLRILADRMNLNYSYVSHVFAKYCKSSFPQYLRSLRIEAAKKYLEHTNDAISIIASTCGFNDSNYFSHIFMEETGLTPTQWRRRYVAKL